MATLALRRGVTLDDLAGCSQKALLVMYDVHELFHFGSDLPSVVQRFGHTVRALLANRGDGPRGMLGTEELMLMGGVSRGASTFMDLVSAARVGQFADALQSTSTCVALFDMMFSSLMMPPGWHIDPMANVAGTSAGVGSAPASDAALCQKKRLAYIPVSGVSVSLSGAGKSHVPGTMYHIAMQLGAAWPSDLLCGGRPPMTRSALNMSKLTTMASEHSQFGWFPDEYTKAVMPQRPDPNAPSGGGSKNFVVSAGELLDYMTPSDHGGGAQGVSVNRTITNPNIFGSTLTLAKARFFLWEDEGGASCRLLKAVIPPETVFKDSVEQTSEHAQRFQLRKFHALVARSWENGLERVSKFSRDASVWEQALHREAKAVIRDQQ